MYLHTRVDIYVERERGAQRHTSCSASAYLHWNPWVYMDNSASYQHWLVCVDETPTWQCVLHPHPGSLASCVRLPVPWTALLQLGWADRGHCSSGSYVRSLSDMGTSCWGSSFMCCHLPPCCSDLHMQGCWVTQEKEGVVKSCFHVFHMW